MLLLSPFFPHRFWTRRLIGTANFISLAFILFSFAAVIITIVPVAFGQGTKDSFDGPAELPRVYVQSDLSQTPSPGNTIHVNAGDNLPDALENASCGDTIELQAGARFAGTFTLPAKSCDDQHWIIIRSSIPDALLPPEGTRVTPCYAGVAALPGRPDFHCASIRNVMAALVLVNHGTSGPILLAAGANHYRLIGLEITRLPGNGPAVNLIQADANADHIILDRVWIHGTAQDETRRGILLSGTTNVAIVDSFFSDFHCISRTGTCTDSQAVAGGSSSLPGGPYKIVNNFLEAAGECILFGGGASTTTPEDIEIRQNHLFKPMIWKLGEPGFVGGAKGNAFIVKNHFELKNATRVLFEGNVAENNWGGFTQDGFSILLTTKGNTTSKESSVNLCAICQVTDVTIRYNTISHIGAGFTIATAMTIGNGLGVPALAGARYSIHDVVVDDIDATKYEGSGTLVLLLNDWSKSVLNNVTITHITAFPESHLVTLLDRTGDPRMSGFVFTNNVVSAGKYPVWAAGGGPTNCAKSVAPRADIAKCFSTYTFESNVIVGSPAVYPPSTWPAENYFVEDFGDVGFADYDRQDYQLLPSSQFSNKGTDGKDIGADINAIQSATAGAY